MTTDNNNSWEPLRTIVDQSLMPVHDHLTTIGNSLLTKNHIDDFSTGVIGCLRKLIDVDNIISSNVQSVKDDTHKNLQFVRDDIKNLYTFSRKELYYDVVGIRNTLNQNFKNLDKFYLTNREGIEAIQKTINESGISYPRFKILQSHFEELTPMLNQLKGFLSILVNRPVSPVKNNAEAKPDNNNELVLAARRISRLEQIEERKTKQIIASNDENNNRLKVIQDNVVGAAATIDQGVNELKSYGNDIKQQLGDLDIVGIEVKEAIQTFRTIAQCNESNVTACTNALNRLASVGNNDNTTKELASLNEKTEAVHQTMNNVQESVKMVKDWFNNFENIAVSIYASMETFNQTGKDIINNKFTTINAIKDVVISEMKPIKDDSKRMVGLLDLSCQNYKSLSDTHNGLHNNYVKLSESFHDLVIHRATINESISKLIESIELDKVSRVSLKEDTNAIKEALLVIARQINDVSSASVTDEHTRISRANYLSLQQEIRSLHNERSEEILSLQEELQLQKETINELKSIITSGFEGLNKRKFSESDSPVQKTSTKRARKAPERYTGI
jgi:hypothetical protein